MLADKPKVLFRQLSGIESFFHSTDSYLYLNEKYQRKKSKYRTQESPRNIHKILIDNINPAWTYRFSITISLSSNV
jgi:hypothetical protein